VLRQTIAPSAVAALVLALAQTPAPAATEPPRTEPPRTELAPEAWHAAYMAAMQGRKADTLAAVQDLAASLSVERLLAAGSSGWELTPQYAALVRFGLWDELIALGRPDARAAGLTAGYLYGRGVALAARGQVAEARTTLAELERLGGGSLNDLVSVAAPVVAARIAATELRSDDAIRELEKAAAAEDGLLSVGRTGWFFPVRHLLGAQLLIAGRGAEAERVYREDLKRNPGNGWALYGLAAALRAQGRRSAAAVSERELAHAWKAADVRLLSSAFWFSGPDTTSCECQRQPSD
jgi:tetratricopeptide (TPR) repeat protein